MHYHILTVLVSANTASMKFLYWSLYSKSKQTSPENVEIGGSIGNSVVRYFFYFRIEFRKDSKYIVILSVYFQKRYEQ